MPNAEGGGLDVDLLRQVTSLAFEFGPFLFAILLLLFVTARARRYYQEVCTRTDPPAKEDEKRAHRRVYYSSWVVSFLLVAVSTAWWFWKENTEFFRFAIFDLRTPELVTTIDDSIYRRIVPQEAAGGKNYFFLLPDLKHPLPQDQPIRLRYFNADSREEKVVMLHHKGLNNQIFIVERDEDEIRFKPIGTLRSAGLSPFAQAWAADMPKSTPTPPSGPGLENPFGWRPSERTYDLPKDLYTRGAGESTREIEAYYKTRQPLSTHEIYQLQEQLYWQKLYESQQ